MWWFFFHSSRFLILDVCFFFHEVIYCFIYQWDLYATSTINNKKSFFTHTYTHAHIFPLCVYLFCPKGTDKHLPTQNKITLSICYPKSYARLRIKSYARKKRSTSHLTKLRKRISPKVIAYVWVYVVRICNMFRLEVNRAKVLTFNTSKWHPFTIPSA